MAINLIPQQAPRLPGGVVNPDDIAHREEIARALAEGAKPKPIEHPLQGIAQMSDAFFGGMVEDKVRKDQKGNREYIAEALSGTYGGEELSPEKLNTVLALDPELGLSIIEQRRAEQQRQEEWARQDALRMQDREWQVGDRADERAYEAPLRDQQLEGGSIQNEAGRIALDQAKTGFTPLVDPAERAAFGINPADTTVWYKGPDGRPYNEAPSAGSSVTINNGDGSDSALDKRLSEKEGDSWAAILDAGMVSGALSQDMQMLDELLPLAPQGPITGRLAETFKGFNSAADAFQSIVKRVAPSLRTPGSGATSDIEYQGFLDSLPALSNQPEANVLISQMMQAKAAINTARSDLVTAYQTGQINPETGQPFTVDETRRKMAELNQQSILTPDLRKAMGGLGASASPVQAGPQVGTVLDGFEYLGGPPDSPTSWRQVQ